MTSQPQREGDTAEHVAEKPQTTQPEGGIADVRETTPEPAAPLAPLENNVHDCALVIEGGAMRASYVSGLVNVLLEQGIYFDYVCGISAGSTVATNYVSRECSRGPSATTRSLRTWRSWRSRPRALVVRPREMPVSRTTRDVKELEHAYLLGHEQGIAELPRWREFLFGE